MQDLLAVTAQRSAEDAAHMQHMLGSLHGELLGELRALGVDLQQLHAGQQDIKQGVADVAAGVEGVAADVADVAAGVEEALDILRRLKSGDSQARDIAEASSKLPTGSSSAASRVAGTPSDLWGMLVPDIIEQADDDHNGSLTARELSKFLCSYGLQVGTSVAGRLIQRFHKFQEPLEDVAELRGWLKQCWTEMQEQLCAADTAGVPEGGGGGGGGGEDEGPVLNKCQAEAVMQDFAGGKGVQAVLKHVDEGEHITFDMLLGYILEAESWRRSLK
jgi:hypothetical protein